MTARGCLTFAAAAVVLLVVAFVAMAALRKDDTAGVDCSTFRVTPDRWASADYDHRLQLREGLTQCRRILGQPSTQVIAQLGPADRATGTELDYDLPFPDATGRQVWRIHLGAGDKVKATQLASPQPGAP
ncbi:MAG: hypothetical protein JWR63_215 [Conexibacter sp.]|nr:hypothetical protein [Conexibacter sp.]